MVQSAGAYCPDGNDCQDFVIHAVGFLRGGCDGWNPLPARECVRARVGGLAMLVAPQLAPVVFLVDGAHKGVAHFDKAFRNREAFVRNTVKKLNRKMCRQVFMCHPHHSVRATDSARQHEIQHVHYELQRVIGTIGFDIYVFPKGMEVTATNYGHGGWENWAGCGRHRRIQGTKTLIFS